MRWILFFFVFICVSAHLIAQVPVPPPEELQESQESQELQESQEQSSEPQQLRGGFGDLLLGTSLAEAKRNIENSYYFLFDEAADVSVVPLSQNALISVDGANYIEQGFLQFDDDALVSIQLILDPRQIDHFSLYEMLYTKYGPPDSLDPQVILWESDAVRMSIERPLILKYVALDYLNATQQNAAAQQQEENDALEIFFRQL